MDLFPAQGFVCPAQPLRERAPVGEAASFKTGGGWGLGGCIISLTLEYFQILILGVAPQTVELTQLGRCFTAENVIRLGQMQTYLRCSSGGVLS